MSDLYLPHQIEKGEQTAAVIRSVGVCYLAGEVRSGKTRTALYALSLLGVKNVIWITKKMAISGIQREIAAVQPSFQITVTNYEQVSKHFSEDYDFVVVDEAHQLGCRGKPTKRVKDVYRLAYPHSVLLLSGTPAAETALALYHQFVVTRHTPLRYKNFFDFFRAWGIPNTIYLHGRQVEQYNKARPGLLAHLEPYIVRMTQQDAGINATAQDIVHKFALSDYTLELIEQIKRDQVITLRGRVYAFESDSAVRVAIHQIEAGAVLLEDEFVMLPNREIVDYILNTFGDSPDVAVMCHFRSTREKLTQHLHHVHLYSSQGHAEGVDLSQYKHFVIANTGYSGSSHIQRRDRGTRIDVTTPRRVHHLMADGQLSENVYSAVSRKLDYNLATFRCQNLRSKREFSNT
jgi:hypothetical protein